jgi:hypothetical protein
MATVKPISAAQLKLLKKLDQKKYREESAKFIAEGPHLVAEPLPQTGRQITSWFGRCL